MEANDYQKAAARTLLSDPAMEFSGNNLMLLWNGLGLTGEAGEVAELLKKGIFQKHGIDKDKLEKELGDVAWYIAAICTHSGIELSNVFEKNIKKIAERYPNGYTSADSVKRVDVK